MLEFFVQNGGRYSVDGDLLFRKFSLVDTVTAFTGSTTLGLFIIHNIVEAHGGSVVAESVPGQWTAFRFTFPTAMAIAKNDKEQPNHA